MITLKAKEGDSVAVGQVVCLIDTDAAVPAQSAAPVAEVPKAEAPAAVVAPVAPAPVATPAAPVAPAASNSYATGEASQRRRKFLLKKKSLLMKLRVLAKADVSLRKMLSMHSLLAIVWELLPLAREEKNVPNSLCYDVK